MDINFGVQQLIGLILAIIGLVYIFRMGLGILWIILLIVGAFLLLKDNVI